jgi:alkylation response protein AidB-like acyl-CoA dehydrogenase
MNMAGQFELGSKHIECMKLASQNISEIGESSPKEIAKKMLAKTYGFIPSESLVYDDYLGLSVALEEISKAAPGVASILADQVLIREIIKAYGNGNAAAILSTGETIGILCSEAGLSSLNNIHTKAVRTGDGQWSIKGLKQICNEQLTSDKYLVFAQDEEGLIRFFIVPEEQITVNVINKSIASAK